MPTVLALKEYLEFTDWLQEETKKLLNAFVKFFDLAEEKVNKAINNLDNLVSTYDDMLNVW